MEVPVAEPGTRQCEIYGIIHNMQPTMRQTVLRRLCSKDEPWSVIFVSNGPNLTPHVDRRIILD
jgi:hypothetical protein